MVVEACCAECALEKGLLVKGLGAKGFLSTGARGLLLDLQGFIGVNKRTKWKDICTPCTARQRVKLLTAR